MREAASGSRGVFWRPNERGTQVKRTERGDWWIRWTCPYPHKSPLHRKLVGPKSLAIKEVARCRLEADSLCPIRKPKPSSYLLADVIREYLDASKDHKKSHRDDVRYGAMWSERFAGRTLNEITAGDVEKVRAERLKAATRSRMPGRIVTQATVNREVAFLRHVFNVAIRDDKCQRNPVAKLRFFKEQGRVRYLTDDEEPRLMAALPTDEDRQRVSVLIHTGLRRSEFLGLRWRDVDFKAGILTIPRSKSGKARHVHMNSAVREILMRRPRSLDRDAFVYANSDGHRDFRWTDKTFPAALRAAKIEDFRGVHDLRHTWASRFVMAGGDPLTLMEEGGWASLAMVQRYAHLSKGHRQAAMERLVRRPVMAIAGGVD